MYLPLCDVTQDGACNSTDALRILMCDVKLAACPGGASSSAPNLSAASDVSPANPAYFRLDETVDAETGELVVRVEAESPHVPLAVAALNLAYDPARFAVTTCTQTAEGMTLAVCNPAYDTGQVRFTGVTATGITAATSICEVRLRALDPAALEQPGQGLIELDDVSAFDLEGSVLLPVFGPDGTAPAPRKLFLPLMMQQAAGPMPAPAPIEVAPEPSPEPPAAPDGKGLVGVPGGSVDLPRTAVR